MVFYSIKLHQKLKLDCVIEICERVQRVPAFDEELCRPEIPESALIDGQIEPNLINLMVSCWAEEFHERPDFAVIRKVVRSLNKYVFFF